MVLAEDSLVYICLNLCYCYHLTPIIAIFIEKHRAFKKSSRDALSAAKKLYEEYNVKVLPGEFLGREGTGVDYWRLLLVYEPKVTKKALERVAEFLKRWD